MGNLQAVNRNPFSSGAKLDVEPFVTPCDDGIGTCVWCLEGFLCFGPANVNILSRLQCLGYMKPCCLCTMRAGWLGPKTFYLGPQLPEVLTDLFLWTSLDDIPRNCQGLTVDHLCRRDALEIFFGRDSQP